MPRTEWFPYFGPNRRSDRTVVEITAIADPDIAGATPPTPEELRALLRQADVPVGDAGFPGLELPDDPLARYAALLAGTAAVLQRGAGHRVSECRLGPHDRHRAVAWVEHEHPDVGMTAVKLAFELVSGRRRQVAEPFRQFRAFAKARRLPDDTRALMDEAARLDIPCVHLERQPYRRKDFDDLTSGRCLRPNGLIRLGHGARTRVLDGLFAVDGVAGNGGDDLAALLDDIGARRERLRAAGIEPAGGITSADRRALVVDGQVVSGPSDLDPSMRNALSRLSTSLGGAPLTAFLTAGNDGPVHVLDFALAPDLDRHPPGEPDDLRTIAGAVLRWLFPEPRSARMPIIAVTGTNGKTTTCRMIEYVLRHAGRHPGLVCTDGVYANGREVHSGDRSTRSGHLDVLANRSVGCAVLETHHAGILSRGFAFRSCEVAACLNVSEDHIGDAHVDSVEAMAVVKRALIERARSAAVLNADDPLCRAMADHVHAHRLCWVSRAGDPPAGARWACTVETVDGEDRIVLVEDAVPEPLMAVADIPATCGGTAGFNVANALHAIACCRQAGIATDDIRAAMRTFRAGPELTPGRLNVYADLPFNVIVDFAHNPEGFRRIGEFAARQTAPGRRLIAFSGSPNRADETLRNIARTVAGHYDHYFCRNFPDPTEERRRDVTSILREALVEAGVESDRISVMDRGREVILEILSHCRPGDLLLLPVGHGEKPHIGEWIREYASADGQGIAGE